MARKHRQSRSAETRTDGEDGLHVFYATSPGKKTRDRDEHGGNPFATALIELLTKADLPIGDLSDRLRSLTEKKSGGFQTPDVPALQSPLADHALWAPSPGSRQALVLVMSRYETLPSLPGAAHDAVRVATALTSAGYRTTTILNPSKTLTDAILSEFAVSSADTKQSLIYTTGHGVEVDGEVYLLPGSFPVSAGNDALPELGIPLSSFVNHMRSPDGNLLFYAGCRDDPLG